MAAANALLIQRDPRAGSVLLDRWKSYTTRVRELVLRGFFDDNSYLPALLDAVADGRVQPWSLSPARRAQLLRFPKEEIKKRAEALFAGILGGDRKKALDSYRPAARMGGDAQKGRQVFSNLCSKCHKVGDIGVEVGPDLAGLTNRTREDLLAQILDPNAYIVPGYEEYAVQTSGGRLITGVMAKETATTVTLRRSAGEEDSILRQDIVSLRSLGVSQMPEELEKGMTLQEMADLLQFLKSLGTRAARQK